MELNERITTLSAWGDLIQNIPDTELTNLFFQAKNKNGWFTEDSCINTLKEIRKWLSKDSLTEWIKSYDLADTSTKCVGIVMAGNIPLVGFHDLLSVLITGHKAKIKLSSQDDELLPYLTNILVSNYPQWQVYIEYAERLKEIDAVIATGSDNSSRYFEHYFKSIPRIIRKNRTSVGVIMGEEGKDEIKKLADDIFLYYGMGCRNVSKIFIPDNFDLSALNEAFQGYQEIINHNKYANNYDYQRAIRLISSKPFHDIGFLIVEESNELVSPISVLYYQFYTTQSQLEKELKTLSNKIQCIVSAKGWYKGSLPFGTAQQPALCDYADGIDTIEFLNTIH